MTEPVAPAVPVEPPITQDQAEAADSMFGLLE